MSVMLKGNWNYPTTVWAGPGRLAELPAACERAGIRRALVVTDRGLLGAQMIGRTSRLVQAPVFGDVAGNPTAAHVEAGLAVYRAGGHDGVVAIGGGAALDTGKTIAFMSGQTRPCGILRTSATGGRGRTRRGLRRSSRSRRPLAPGRKWGALA
jgi:alcohol dehydrogenase class IV